ncbi:hypothetical protein Bca52824_074142 [Brassica carinata]|uniref:Reverse transcriptase zinc-binding domain-containing protein n=1 Tax=Brassica carinata TaxID=52824 RepID=A0A8X7QFC3_BRACI|nr:hypothetical protein Bca52824_074142 [Brassica carinata]
MCRLVNEQARELWTEPSISSLTQQVWKVKTVPKIRHFMWQSLSNCIPVCSRLADRHCHPVRTCQRCGHDDETVNHLLFECPLATQTWTLAQLPFHPGEFQSSSIYSNFDCLLNRVHKQNGSEDSLGPTSEKSNWRLVQIIPDVSEESDNMDMPELPVRPPRRPLCRFDASWKEDDARFGGGLVIEKEDGITIFGSFASNRVLSPVHAEFSTLLWAMKSSLLLGHDSMDFEPDCLQLKEYINNILFGKNRKIHWRQIHLYYEIPLF